MLHQTIERFKKTLRFKEMEDANSNDKIKEMEDVDIMDVEENNEEKTVGKKDTTKDEEDEQDDIKDIMSEAEDEKKTQQLIKKLRERLYRQGAEKVICKSRKKKRFIGYLEKLNEELEGLDVLEKKEPEQNNIRGLEFSDWYEDVKESVEANYKTITEGTFTLGKTVNLLTSTLADKLDTAITNVRNIGEAIGNMNILQTYSYFLYGIHLNRLMELAPTSDEAYKVLGCVKTETGKIMTISYAQKIIRLSRFIGQYPRLILSKSSLHDLIKYMKPFDSHVRRSQDRLDYWTNIGDAKKLFIHNASHDLPGSGNFIEKEKLIESMDNTYDWLENHVKHVEEKISESKLEADNPLKEVMRKAGMDPSKQNDKTDAQSYYRSNFDANLRTERGKPWSRNKVKKRNKK